MQRRDLGFDEDAIVLCNFNRSSKWSPDFFDVWINALVRFSRAILWLAAPVDPLARSEIERRAADNNVLHKLRWAERVSISEHLSRLACADLALDQLPYSSHATGADALWMGVPLLTVLGDTFQGRVGASLVRTVGLPDFICRDLADYEQKLNGLLSEPKALADAKTRVHHAWAESALFDSCSYANAFEDLLESITFGEAQR